MPTSPCENNMHDTSFPCANSATLPVPTGIFRLRPSLKSVVWGGTDILHLKGLDFPEGTIGESWELSDIPGHRTIVEDGPDHGMSITQLIEKYGEGLLGKRCVEMFGMEMPLLVKIIDARQNLSVQVHPDEALAQRVHGSHGKTEMWYILKAAPDARIYAGLKEKISRDDFRRSIEDETLMDVVASSKPEPGDVYFLPAGRVHAIGAGNLLVEIQQSSDITYRVFDYGRGRALHVEQALEAIDFETILPDYRTSYDKDARIATIVDCPYFRVERRLLDTSADLLFPGTSFTIVVCVGGRCVAEASGRMTALSPGTALLIPAALPSLRLLGHAILLTATIP